MDEAVRRIESSDRPEWNRGRPEENRGRRIAFFGGSFDPPHLGHLAVARAASEALGLDSVLFAPVGAQPLKPQGSAASFEDRLAMTKLAIAGEPGFEVSLADAPKPSGAPSYTLETLFTLRAELEPDGALFCLMGADSFVALRRWHRGAEIPFVAPLIVASRPFQPCWLLNELQAELPEGLTLEAAPEPEQKTEQKIELRRYLLRNPAGDHAAFYLLPNLQVEISAAQIRDGIRNRTSAVRNSQPPTHKLLPEAVANYIYSHRLYL